tara:strand:- start:4177 stop:4383 length:207 start_codon:yes stop_codon:yes gene_type:complete
VLGEVSRHPLLVLKVPDLRKGSALGFLAADAVLVGLMARDGGSGELNRPGGHVEASRADGEHLLSERD